MEQLGEVKPRLGRRLVVFPVPLQGHINPMLQLANILYSNGFSITILHTQFNAPNQFNYPHFSFQQLPPQAEAEAEASWEVDVIASLNHLNQCLADPFRDCLSRLISDSYASRETEPVACLITDALWHFSQSIADSLKLPRICLRTSSLACLVVYSSFPLLRDKGYFLDRPNQWESEAEARVPDFPLLKGKDIPNIFTDDPNGFYKLIGNMMKEAKVCSGIIWNSFRELEESELGRIVHEFPVQNFAIGPFHKYFPASSSSLLAQDPSSISWLDQQAPRSVIYVSFGSVVKLDEAGFKEIAWGLANSMQPFLWVVRPGSVSGSQWLEHLPDELLVNVGASGRGHIVQWAPQQQVLAHPSTGAFWTHCGWNSTLESICEGVPMICSPFFADQPIDARYVSDVWKVGLLLENGWEREEIQRTIKRLVFGKDGQEIRERIISLKEKIDDCLKEGGSSRQSLNTLVRYILSF